MEDKTKLTIGAVIALALVISGAYYITPSELDHTFICTINKNIGVFMGGISNTALTAYPYKENRTDYVRCRNADGDGIWMLLEDYAKENGLNINDLLAKDETKTVYVTSPSQSEGTRWLCSPENCVRIE